MALKHLAAAAAVAAALAGCATSGVSIVEDMQTGYYAAEEYGRDASTGPMTVVVRGSAFGLNQAALANLVVQNMQGNDWGPHATFTPVSGANTARMYSYVMVLNGPRSLNVASLCEQPNQPVPAATDVAAGEVRLAAALCRYSRPTNSVSGRAAGVVGPYDPKVGQLIGGAVREMTRPNQERIDRNFDNRGFNFRF
jgi:hypothetical protein